MDKETASKMMFELVQSLVEYFKKIDICIMELRKDRAKIFEVLDKCSKHPEVAMHLSFLNKEHN